ncbi:triose-phosphate isomerase [Candidatus Dependentiae bacterium]|nr:triose-phosphate isomerase [Candidatus Dependentiae bacterium]MBU4387668.1 triose-phosphate isomerase [Candidatus Dependentiae bacterium]MCG2756055.1 triose-phosphate isomerase [Candidatus Dependentiae bacterium]
MKKNFTIISNWKMYLDTIEELKFATINYDNFIKLTNSENKIILCPSFLSLSSINQIFKSTDICIGAQNCSTHLNGNFTGQISVESFNKLGIKYSIIGHSETRREFNESNIDIANKFSRLIDFGITPILCIGEELEEKKSGKTLDVLTKQLDPIFKIMENSYNKLNHLELLIAYEPIWAIGSGIIPDQDYLENIFSWLHKNFSGLRNKIVFTLLYGGSVNAENVKFLKNIKNIDGFLIGKSSLDFQEFEKIVKYGI